MPAATEKEPLAFVVWFREQRPRARWRKIATCATHSEAVALTNGKGNWWIAPIYDAALLESASATNGTGNGRE